MSSYYCVSKCFGDGYIRNLNGVYYARDWVCLVAQIVKNLPAMQETQVRSLGPEGLLERGMATHSSILACRIPWTACWTTVREASKSQTRLNDFHFTCYRLDKIF